ncbi:MAG TPA: hypothetical protein VKH35_04835 [Thermoanaerobaculia bacterium]|nr:hypothetical protein [Thermoanaerobaculia bacterium]
MPRPSEARGGNLLPRREFLKLGSLTTLGFMAGAFRPALLQAMPLESRNPGDRPLLAVAYSDALPADGESVRLVSASSMTSGDPEFISRGARLTFGSFSRLSNYRERLADGIAVDVVFPANSYTEDHLPRFRAWSFNAREDGDMVAAPISFNVPVTATDGIQLVLRRMTPGVAETAATLPRGGPKVGESSFPLRLGFGSALAKLQRGIYVIALRETVDDVNTGWNSFRLANRNGTFVLTPSPFTYLVMTIDYAH